VQIYVLNYLNQLRIVVYFAFIVKKRITYQQVTNNEDGFKALVVSVFSVFIPFYSEGVVGNFSFVPVF
jgi:hypothetical protein